MIKPIEVLTAAINHIEERASTYDASNGERSMEKTVQMFNVLMGSDRFMITEQGWLFMVLLKIVRSQQGEFKLDNYEDLAAYAALAAEEASRMPEDDVTDANSLTQAIPRREGYP